ncbi:MAG: Wzz/FepE/Etk N-terminal domain-containing protein [Thermoguttaceae bacterium]
MPDYQDDLSLAGVWRVLVRQWKVIATTTIFSVVAAAGYLFVATPQYEAEVVVLPPEPHHVEALNIPDIHEATPEQIHAVFVRNLRSNALRRRFFDEQGLFSALAGKQPSRTEASVFQEQFNDRLKVKKGTRDEEDFIFVSLSGEDAEQVAAWLNEFAQLAVTKTADEVIDGVSRRITHQRDSLQEHVAISRNLAKQRREDRITTLEEKLAILRDGHRREDRLVVLDEQIAIARELNIMDRDDAVGRILKEPAVNVSVSTDSEPLYLRGVNELVAEREAIEKREDDDPFLPELREVLAEIEVLKNRTNDDPFIPGLREKEEQIAQLDANLDQLHSSAEAILPARIDQKAVAPRTPSSPKKSRILPLSLVAGLLLGVFAAFQVNALEQSRS